MRATERLYREHGAIAAMLERLDGLVTQSVERGEHDLEAFERLLSFFEEHVDGQHQEQEERVFLPRLFTRADGDDVQQVSSILHEHVGQRQLLIQMRCHLRAAAVGDPEAFERLEVLGRRYVERQRLHAAWEDAVILPLAERVFTERDDRALENGFRHYREAWGGDVVEAARRVAVWLDNRQPMILA